MKKSKTFGIFATILTVMLVMVLTLGAATPAQAAEIRDTGVLNASETIDDDLLIGGDQVRVDGTVNGMLVAGGNTVTVNGTINGDAVIFAQSVIISDKAVITGNLFTGAQTVDVRGAVGGSIAAGSASMVHGSKVGRNIYYGGYSLETTASSSVERGLYVGARQATLKGAIARDLNAGVSALQLDGSVGGNALVQVERAGERGPEPYFYGPYAPAMPASIPSGLRVGPDARINGKLVYTSQTSQSAAIQAAPAGGVVYQTPAPKTSGQGRPIVVRTVSPVVTWLYNFLRNFFTLLLLGLLAARFVPAVMSRTGEIVRGKPAQSAGYGLVTIIVGYTAAIMAGMLILALGLFLALVTLGGLSGTVFGIGFSGLSLVMAAFTLVVSYVSKLVVAYLVGDLILAGASPALQGRRYWAIALGVLIYTLVRSIPFLGWVIGLLVTIVGVGALWMYYRSRQAPAAAIEAAASQ